MIRRKLQTIIEQALKASTSNNVLLVQGARQVGKTSLVESILKEMSDVCQTNLEEDVTLKIAIDQCVDFSEFETILKAEKGFDKGKTVSGVLKVHRNRRCESTGLSFFCS